ncbi:MAG: ABC transporter ATP-binding protein [Lachnospiraceae bacterium]|nr:ABC transporter ATP-binding protein [Lachnospiraceae bacterium]
MMGKILEVNHLTIHIKTHKGTVQAVRDVSFCLNEQETLAVVGESGSGKSITMKGIMGILPKNGKVTEGSVLYDGKELTKLTERQMQNVRGSEIAMVFQDPMTSLNPTMRVGKQIEEMLRAHKKDMTSEQRKKRGLELLELVGISNPEERYRQYPHQLSGGMRQRVVIAIALACEPKVLIADEPTTALDVTIQAQILDLMRSLQTKIKTSIIIITHNLGVVANIADRVAVMYGGKLVETGAVSDIFHNPLHEYTKGLLKSVPKAQEKGGRLQAIPGTPPDLMDPPKGCPFAARCMETMLVCQKFMPEDTDCSENHRSACWLLDERAGGVS